ncbi:hypothetical protein Tco_0604335 [Tanacetum coccineum]
MVYPLNPMSDVVAGTIWLLTFGRALTKQCSYRTSKDAPPSTYIRCTKCPPISASMIIGPSVPSSSSKRRKRDCCLTREKLWVTPWFHCTTLERIFKSRTKKKDKTKQNQARNRKDKVKGDQAANLPKKQPFPPNKPRCKFARVIRHSRSKAIVAKVSTSASTSGVSPDVAELKDMVRALLLDKQTSPVPTPAPVKVVEQSCVTCGGAHSYHNFPATDSNNYRDNIHEYISQAAAANFNQGNSGYRLPPMANQIRLPSFPPMQHNSQAQQSKSLEPKPWEWLQPGSNPTTPGSTTNPNVSTPG